MKYRVFVVFGEESVEIVNNQIKSEYDRIKDEINIFEFNTNEEMEAFKKGLEVGVGNSIYQILEEDEMIRIMDYTK